MNNIRVLLSDHQFLTREGLINLIEQKDGFELMEAMEQPDSVLDKVLLHHPDVLVMDYSGDDPVLRSLMKQVVETRATNVLIITNEQRKQYIKELLDLGIRGIVTKNCSRQEILNAIEAISESNRFFCNKILDVLMTDGLDNEPVSCEATTLSPREFEVLQLITKGFKTIQIADELNVSVHTINSHRKNILRKLNLKSPTELVVYAMESGLVKA